MADELSRPTNRVRAAHGLAVCLLAGWASGLLGGCRRLPKPIIMEPDEPVGAQSDFGDVAEMLPVDDKRGPVSKGEVLLLYDFWTPPEGCPVEEQVPRAELQERMKNAAGGIQMLQQATGCVVVAASPETPFGTAFVIDHEQGLVLTARHVITEALGVGIDDEIANIRLQVRPLAIQIPCTNDAYQPSISVVQLPLVEVALDGLSEGRDLMALRVQGELPPAPLLSFAPLAPTSPTDAGPRWVLVLGYPAKWALRDEYDNARYAAVETRCAPPLRPLGLRGGVGFVVPLKSPDGTASPIFAHTADTLPGLSGGPVMDLHTQQVIGVHTHFAGGVDDGSLSAENQEILKTLENPDDHNLAFSLSPLDDLVPDVERAPDGTLPELHVSPRPSRPPQ